jgi:hypothetical protein
MLLHTIAIALLLASGQATPQAVPSGEELRSAYSELKSAEEKKDAASIMKWALETSNLARSVIKASKAEGEDEAAIKALVPFAKEIETYADYALYAVTLRAPDAAKRIEYFEAFYKQSPDSEYVPQLYSLYAGAMAQTGGSAKLYQFAEKAIARDGKSEELLLILADGAMSRKQWDRAADYGSRLAEVMTAHSRPANVPTGDWERRRTQLMGRGHWIAGLSYANVNKYPQADRNLRAGLPYLKGDQQMTAGALFYLGLANYNMARATQNKPRMKEALAFSEQAAAIPGAYAQPAAQNAWAIKGELSRMR